MEDLEKIALQLKSLHCPMNWNVPEEVELSPTRMIEKLETKLGETEEEGIFKWHKFVLTLLLCSEYYKTKQYDKALEKQKQCEAVANISDSKGYYEKLFTDTKAALFHVLIACECHILYALGETATLEERLKEIPKFEDMNTQSKAALLGIQSSVSMEYGHEGNKMGLKLIEKALELNPDEGEWHFLLGRCLVRIRHVEDYISIPSDREIKALNHAYTITSNPSYLTFMATAHREAAENVRHSTGVFLKEDYERSYSLYRMALEKTGKCSHVLARCAFGFWKLPLPYRDPELAKKCYEKALAIAPKNIMANHIAGIISNSYDRDYKKAKEYYLIAAEGGAYGAHINLHQLRLCQEDGYDPIPDLEIMLKRFYLEPRLSQTKIHLGAAYLFLRNDLSTALDYWMDVIDGPERDTLKQYKCYFLASWELLNVYELIINETRLALKENKINADDKLKFQQALQKCIEKQPELDDLVLSSPQSWKEKYSIRNKHTVYTHTKRGKGKQKNISRRSDNEMANSNWREKGTSEGRKSHEFRRSESSNSGCDGEENLPKNHQRERGEGNHQEYRRSESYHSSFNAEEDLPFNNWRVGGSTRYESGRGQEFIRNETYNSSCDSEENVSASNGRGRGKTGEGEDQEFRRTESYSSGCDGEENVPSYDQQRRGRDTYGRGKCQGFGRSESFNSNCNNEENMPGGDWKARGRLRKGRGRSVDEYKNGEFSKRDLNTKGCRESRVDISQSSNGSEHHAANSCTGETFNSNRGRGRADVRRNLDSNWRLR